MHYRAYRSILSPGNNMNIYRGCQHGCIYCDSRSLCYQMQHAFEDIEVKKDAPEMLDDVLRRKRAPAMIGTGAMCDPYMPLEKELRYTRRCLKVIERYGFGASVLTKSDLVMRDMDIIQKIHQKTKFVLQMTLTTYEEALCKVIEPNVCTTKKRIRVLNAFRDAGIPTIVWLSPILPYINDTMENLCDILEACVAAKVRGVICYGMGMTLRDGNRAYYYQALDKHFPGLKSRYIKEFGNDYEIQSPNGDELWQTYKKTCAKHGIMSDNAAIFAYLRELPQRYEQLMLF